LKRTARASILNMEFQPLLSFVNDLTSENWRQALTSFDEQQLFEAFGWDVGSEHLPTVNGSPATYRSAKSLQKDIRDRLVALTKSEKQQPGHWSWRRALVLPTRQIYFEDAGEGFRFLAERLAYEISECGSPKLHLGQCRCGCQTFFLWEGNWQRKKRLFLDNKHRMRYHNERNVENKRQFAWKRRHVDGDGQYF
jgi:hypothetical protein